MIDQPGRNANLAWTLSDAADVIAELRSEGAEVFVHCAEARSRIAAVVALYRIRHRGVGVGQAWRDVEGVLPHFAPASFLVDAVRRVAASDPKGRTGKTGGNHEPLDAAGEKIAARIASDLGRLRGTGRAYTVDLGHAFFQAASYDGDQVLIEISAERFMPADRALAPGSHKQLMQLGFSRPTTGWPSWWIAMEHSSDDELLHAARATTTALLTVYEMSATDIAEALGMPALDREQSTEEGGRDAGVRVQLRAEERPDGSWLNLWASLDGDGNLRLDGQDLGPVTRSVSPDGEYEYVTIIAAADVPRFVELAGGTPGHGVLGLLADRWSGPASFELERMLRASDIPVEVRVWS